MKGNHSSTVKEYLNFFFNGLARIDNDERNEKRHITEGELSEIIILLGLHCFGVTKI